MFKSSEIFKIKNDEEKEINFDLRKINRNGIFVFKITNKKCIYCASYCFCGFVKCCKENFYIKSINSLYKIIFININSGEKFEEWISANIETKYIEVPMGEYKIEIPNGDNVKRTFQIYQDSLKVLSLDFYV